MDPLHTKLISDTKRHENLDEIASANKTKEVLNLTAEDAVNTNQGMPGDVVSIVMGVNV